MEKALPNYIGACMAFPHQAHRFGNPQTDRVRPRLRHIATHFKHFGVVGSEVSSGWMGMRDKLLMHIVK